MKPEIDNMTIKEWGEDPENRWIFELVGRIYLYQSTSLLEGEIGGSDFTDLAGAKISDLRKMTIREFKESLDKDNGDVCEVLDDEDND